MVNSFQELNGIFHHFPLFLSQTQIVTICSPFAWKSKQKFLSNRAKEKKKSLNHQSNTNRLWMVNERHHHQANLTQKLAHTMVFRAEARE